MFLYRTNVLLSTLCTGLYTDLWNKLLIVHKIFSNCFEQPSILPCEEHLLVTSLPRLHL